MEAQSMPHKKILALYTFSIVTVILLFTPWISLALGGLFLYVVLLIMLSVIKSRAQEDSFTHEHAVFLSKTFWRAKLICLICLFISVFYLLLALNHSEFNACIGNTIPMDRLEVIAQNSDYAALMNLAKPCTDLFLTQNLTGLIIGGLIAFAPVILFMIFRFVTGLRAAIKSEPPPVRKRKTSEAAQI